jgi:drug/metabolite transporter, DME family
VRLRRERDLLSDPAASRSDASRTGRFAPLAVVAAAMLWGTTGTSQALLDGSVPTDVVGALRLTVGGSALALAALPAGRTAWATLRRAPVWAAIGAASLAVYQLAFFAAVGSIGVAVGTMVAVGSAPLQAGVLVALVDRRRPSRGWVIGTSVAVVGLALLLAPGTQARPTPAGTAAALTAGGSYALFTLSSKRLLDRGVPRPVAMGATFGAGGLLLLPVLLGGDAPAGVGALVVDPLGAAVVAWLGLATVLVAYRAYARGLARLRPESVTTYSLAEPLTAAVLGLAVLGEAWSMTATAGAAAVIAGMALSADDRPRRSTPRPRPSTARGGAAA